MLADHWRFIVYNKDTTITLDFSANSANEKASAQFKRGYINPSDGLIDRESNDSTTHSAGTDLADGKKEVLTAVATEENTIMHGIFHVETDDSGAAGDVVLGIEHSPDQGTTWPSDAADWDPDTDMTVLKTITLSGAESHSTNFEV